MSVKKLTNEPAIVASIVATLLKHGPGLISGGRSLLNWTRKKKKGGRVQTNSTNQAQGGSRPVPVAVNNWQANPTYWYEESLPMEVGIHPGLRIVGRQYLTGTQVTIALADLFSGGAASTANLIQLSPDAFGGRVALIARTYLRYAFRHVRVYFVTAVATSNPGSMALSYVADGASTAAQTFSFASSFQNNPCVVGSSRENLALEMNYTGVETFNSELDTATTAGARESVQGQILGYWDGTGGSAAIIGYFLVEYVLDMYQPCADFGYTVSTRDPEFRRYIEAYETRSNDTVFISPASEYTVGLGGRSGLARR